MCQVTYAGADAMGEGSMNSLGQGDPQQRTVIFLHIPKAAGTTLRKILNRNYKRGETFWVDASRVRESTEEFKNLPYYRRLKIKLLAGHIPFGLHEFLPQPVVYITMLRDPVDRIISHYYHVIRHPEHYLYHTVRDNNMGLKDYVTSGISTELDNGQTRQLAGGAKIGIGECSEDLLEQAESHLRDHIAIAGLTERFDETLILMRKALRWTFLPCYTKFNVSQNRPPSGNVPQDVVDLIRRHNQLDCELYQYAKELFQQRIQELGPNMEKELRTFKVLNGLYFAYRRPYLISRSFLGKIYHNLRTA
jgi:hypothetical protein